jgi:ankyrin repeat protein
MSKFVSIGNPNKMKEIFIPKQITKVIENNTKEKELALSMISDKPNINHRFPNWTTALMYAAANSPLNIVKECVEKGANIDLVDSFGNTAIMFAVLYDKTENAKYLLSINANIKVLNKNKESILHYAVAKNNIELIKILCENKCYLNTTNINGKTPLMYAVCSKKISISDKLNIIKILVESGADLEIKDKEYQNTALMCCFEEPEIANYLIDIKADVYTSNIIGDTPILFAALFGKLELFERLHKMGFDLNKKNLQGNSAINFAVGNNHINILKYLLDNNANVNVFDSQKESLLSICILYDRYDMLKLILEKDASSINTYSKSNHYTPLLYATLNNKLDFVKLLLEYGADPNLTSALNYSPLYFAVTPLIPYGQSNYEMVELLIKKGADINCRYELGGFGRIHGVIEYGNSILAAARRHFDRKVIGLLESLNAIDVREY